LSKSKKEDIIVSFSDSSAIETVTGSNVHVSYKNINIMIEFGLFQGGNMQECYSRNSRNFSFKVKELDYVFAMHNHIDHIGLIPLLYKRGCEAKIIIPTGSKEIMYKMLSNCSFILGSEAEILTKRSKNSKIYSPIYTQEDVDNIMKYIEEYDMYEVHGLDDLVRFKLISSAHVTNGTSLVLEIKKGQNYKKILYTSDLGNIRYKTYYCNNLDKIKNADLVISECTYADKKRSNSNPIDREKDKEKIYSAVEQHRKVLIPVFSFHRGQTIATILYEMYYEKGIDRMIYMDSMLLNDITDIYKKNFPEFHKVMDWDKIKQITKKERDVLQNSKEKMIIIASSGSLVGGASVSWAKKLIEDDRNCIVFCGYQFEGSLGSKLKSKKQKTVNINRKTFKNKVNIVKLKSLSGHIQHDDLLEYLSSINCSVVALHHGNENDKLAFKNELKNEYEKLCKSTKVICPSRSTKIRL